MTTTEVINVGWILYAIAWVAYTVRSIYQTGHRHALAEAAIAKEPTYRTPVELDGRRLCTIISTGPVHLELAEGLHLQTRDGAALFSTLDDLIQ